MLQKPSDINGEPVPYGAPLSRLAEIVKSPGPGAWAAFVAIAYDESREALDLLVKLTRDDDATIRRAAVEAIRYHRDGASAGGRAAELALDDNKTVALAAAETASYLKLQKIHGQILILLKSNDPTIRERAVRMFEKIWIDGDFEVLLEMLKSDRSDAVRKESAMILFARVDADHWRSLFDIFVSDRVPRHRVFACELVARFAPAKQNYGSVR